MKKMDMYQKRKIRAEMKNINQEEKLTKVGINWSGGQLEEGNGFWGGYGDQEAIKETIERHIKESRGDSAKGEK